MIRSLLVLAVFTAAICAADEPARFAEARANGRRFDEASASMQRLMKAWLRHADPKTLLLPDRFPGRRGLKEGDAKRLYTPHNSAADLYPYLILTAHLTDPDLYRGRMIEMLRNEIRYTTVQDSIPGNLELTNGELGPPSLFGAGEYAKDGLVSVTEYLGRTPWFYRMVDLIADAMNRAPVESRFGKLPASDSELNGDYLQVLTRLFTMTGDRRFLEWGRRIADAYFDEVLPGSHGVPSGKWNFTSHEGDGTLRLRDHGNEAIVGLVLQFAVESELDTPRAERWRPAIARMLDRVLASANPDGLLYDQIDAETLKPSNSRLSDNWGYVYGAVYTYHQITGEVKYRDAVRKVLGNLTKYRNHVWEGTASPEMPLGSFDGYADSLESAIYLIAREPVPEALGWVESEMKVMMAMQKPDGHIENWYGEGNYNRTVMLYALMKSCGVRPESWSPGVRVGAVRDGGRLYLSLEMPGARKIQFDYARHRRVMNLGKNYVRLNEFPEWYAVDENSLYRVRLHGKPSKELVLLGSELIGGVSLAPGNWMLEPLGKAPYGSPQRQDPR
jgi:hypothetical protein